MKVTSTITYRNMLNHLDRTGSRLGELREMAVSGKKIVRASDDPSAVASILATRSEIKGSEGYLGAMGAGLDRLRITDDHLDHAGDVLTRAKELAIASVNGTLNADDRSVMAEEFSQLKEELLGVANAQVAGRYLFGGFSETAPPFPATPPYDYQGDAGAVELEIGPGERVQVNVPGDELFQAGADIFAVLSDIETALRADDPAAVQGRLDALEAGMDQVRNVRGKLGNTAARIESAQGFMEGVNIDLQGVLSGYEDADIVETVTSLTEQENAFEAALSVTSKISQLSILDYL